MATHVYDYKTHRAQLYVVNDYVYSSDDQQAKFWIKDKYWYPYPTSGQPVFWQQGKFVYPYPSGAEPAFYFA
jgi:hypothetical protein